MERVVFFVSFLVILSASVAVDAAAASNESTDALENSIESRALYHRQGARNTIVVKVQCVTDTIDVIAAEYHSQPLWQEVQTRVHGNIGNLFGCLKYNGFAAQGCVAREVISLGLAMNRLLGGMDSNSAEGGKQLRLQLAGNCSK